MADHATLSASGSMIWVNCAGSVEAQRNIPKEQNKHMAEGELVHELAERIFYKKDYTDLAVTDEMILHATMYVNYINSIASGIKTVIYTEKRVDYSNIAQGQFGTADCIVLTENIEGIIDVYIIDLKYGYLRVPAENNTQLLLYAIGALNTLREYPDRWLLKHVDNFHLVIVQPRLGVIDTWSIGWKEIKFWEGYLKAKAEAALQPGALRTPNEAACKYCKANTTCIALHDFYKTVIDHALPSQPQGEITDQQVSELLSNSKLITTLLKNFEDKVYDKLMSGNKFPGFKLVEGRKYRKLNADSEEKLVELLGEKVYSKSLLGVKELEKLLDEETLNSLVHYSTTKPLLVSENDKRDALIMEELCFEPVEE